MEKNANTKQRKRRLEQGDTKLSFTKNMVGYIENSRDSGKKENSRDSEYKNITYSIRTNLLELRTRFSNGAEFKINYIYTIHSYISAY